MAIKILLFILIFCSLNLLREGFLFYRAIINGKSNITPWRLVGVGLSISYVLTIIITGFIL